MIKRRDLLVGMLAMPLVSGTSNTVQILEEPHALSIEAGKGYRALAGQTRRGGVIILPASRGISLPVCERLFGHVLRGSCLVIESGLCFSAAHVWEQQSSILKQAFDLIIQPCVKADSYLRYSWPIETLVRSFHAVTPIVCDDWQVIARHQSLPVCAMKRLGRGHVVYLGSMLGPGLFSDEPEAHLLGNALLAGFHQSERRA